MNSRTRTLVAGSVTVPCRLGRAGVVAATAKREGDGATPAGSWPLREVLLRPDSAPKVVTTSLPRRWLTPTDGWSDDPADPAYNRPVRHPHAFSAERLWRDDGLYDVIVPMGYNDDPVVPGRGSAIFFHCTAPGQPHTLGCVAVDRAVLIGLLPYLTPASRIEIA